MRASRPHRPLQARSEQAEGPSASEELAAARPLTSSHFERATALAVLGDPHGAGCASSESCGDAAERAAEKASNHPCYSAEAHHHFARMHVAVAPACNIQCHYCNRKYHCAAEGRPGVTRERLTPEEAVARVLAVGAAIPQLSVVGIAGPGDPLANAAATFRTIELVSRAAPDLKLCISTNGLALSDHAERMVSLGVEHVTVTVNAIDPDVGARIHPWIAFRGRRLRGREAARILSERQLDGIERLCRAGAVVKVNSVLIPGVNDAHIPEVSRRVRSLGAFIHNVMPLLSAPEHGTHFGLSGQRGPTDGELEAVRAACEGARAMRHCRQCRADAVGLLGADLGAELRAAPVPAGAETGVPARVAYRSAVERLRAREAALRAEALAAVQSVPEGLRIRVAVATKGEGLVNEHFGHARELHVYEASRSGARLVAIRKVERYCRGGDGEDDALTMMFRALSDCAAVLVSRIGRCPREALAATGIEATERHAFEPIVPAVLATLRVHVERGRAAEASSGSGTAGGRAAA